MIYRSINLRFITNTDKLEGLQWHLMKMEKFGLTENL
jgi:hypothetical protein